MKTCLICNISKNENEFYKIKDKRMLSGFRFHSYCKFCKLKMDKFWREKHQYEMKAYREARKIKGAEHI